MLKTHKIALDPNNKQRTLFARSAGVARFAYNWALSMWDKQYAAHKTDPAIPKPSQYSLRKELNAIKRSEFPWMLEVTKCAPQEAIINLGKAYQNFFAGRAKHPAFKKRGIHDSFKMSSGFFSVDGKTIRLSRIGTVKMREEIRYHDAKFISVTISRRADRWYASVVCDVDMAVTKPAHTGNAIGIDAGVYDYVDSDGYRYPVPRSYSRTEKSLRRAQKSLSRKKKGSRNRRKQQGKVAKLHAKISDIRQDFLHKMTTGIVRHNDVIVIEDLNVSGMMKNPYLAKSIADASFGEFRRQLTYKAEEYGRSLIIADRYFPSSKICSSCGAKTKSMPLNIRNWACEMCGAAHDRDINAAVNLKRYAGTVQPCQPVESSSPLRTYACYGNPASNLDEAGMKQQISA